MPVECFEMNLLSLKRAKRIAPKEFVPAYEWFEQMQGKEVPRIWNNTRPAGIEISIMQQRGIAKPKGHLHAISVTSTNAAKYEDVIFPQEDGTWVFQYCAHRPDVEDTSTSKTYNTALERCLLDGLPVGVFVKSNDNPARYTVLGLAFVEAYDKNSGLFTLHGPVESDQPLDFWSIVPEAELDNATRQELKALKKQAGLHDEADERVAKLSRRIQRVGQELFRAKLLTAYHNRCALTECDVDSALQAAHICAYRGPKSQETSNGLLLRADIHLLYDAHKISIEPKSRKVYVCEEVAYSTHYQGLQGLKLRKPSDANDQPSSARLANHFSTFEKLCEIRGEQIAG
ncbi:HNH endonuclease signature motif containing protein [Slackia piriformis]|jgi:putative restriction endonuclease|nr:HNH endonuclease signature motif containing protein [Slackia piriformis]